MFKKVLLWGGGAVLLVLLVIQLVPYGRDHTNPPVRSEVQWRTQQGRDLVVRACYDCHSNKTVWPWYSNIAPVSWLIQRDVNEGRQTLNFTEWGSGQEGGGEAAEMVRSGEMPLRGYTIMHPSANLSDADKSALIDELVNTLGTGEGEGGDEGEREGDND